MTSKNSDKVAQAFKKIYRRRPLTWPEMLQVDPGREFMGAVSKETEKHKPFIRRGRPDIHRDQAIVERFNRTLAERLFGHQYAVEMLMPEGKRSTAWVKRPRRQKTRRSYQRKVCFCKTFVELSQACGDKRKKLAFTVRVRYLYQPDELEGGTKRATDPNCSLKVFNIERIVQKPGTPVMYYLRDGPKRSFVREELLVIPPDTQLPPRRLAT